MATVSANELSLEKTLEELITEFNSLRGDVSSVTLETLLTTASSTLTFEGATNDAYETSLTVVDPTADRTITLPNVSGTVITDANADTPATTSTFADLDQFLIADGGVLKKMALTTIVTSLPTLTPANADGSDLGSTAKEWSDLYLADSSIIYFGNDQDTTLTHTDGSGLTLNSTNKLMFNDASQFIQGASATVLDIAATDEIELTATLIDVVGNLTVSGTIVGAGALTAATSITVGSAVLLEAELELLDGLTAGTAIASKVVTTDASIDTTGQRNLTISGELDAATGDFSGAVDVAGATTTAAITASGIIKTDDTTAATSTTDGSLQTDGGLSVVLDAVIGDDLFMLSDAAVITFGAGKDVTLTHVHDTGLLLNSTMALQFNDASQFINAPSATVLDINATDEIELNATLVDVNANLDVSGTIVGAGAITGGGLMTTGGNIVIPNAGNIGSAGDTDALAIGSDGDVTLTQDLELQHDGVILSFGANDEVTLTHVHDTGILLNSTMAIQFNDASQFINAPSNAILDINATDEIELNATLVDVNANLDVSGTGVFAGEVTATGFTGTLDGVLGGGTAAAATTTTLASTTITASGIIKTDDTTAATSTTDGSLQTDGGLSVTLDAVIGDDLFMLSDAAVITFGAGKDVTLTHVHDTGLLLNGTSVIQFNDASQNIGAPSATVLDINATDEIELNATLVDINANVEISGNLTVSGTTTQVDTVTMNAANAVVFEGATADDHEITLTIIDPTADRTQRLINQSGYVPLLAAVTTTAITSTPAELNILDGATLDVTELNTLDGITAVVGELNALDIGATAIGTAVASKAVILDSSKDYTGINNLTIAGEIDAATGDFSGAVDVAGATTTAAITASGIIKTDDSTAATSTTDGSLQTDGGLSVVLDAVIGDDIIMISDASIIHFGVNADVTIKHEHDAGLTITNHVNGTDDRPVILQLKSEEDAIVATDVIASIQFSAGDSDGTDGATVAAGIHAIAEGTFSASANATKLVFTTGVSETAAASATAKMTLSSAGLLTLADDLIIKNAGTVGTAADADLLTLGNGNLTVAGTVTATAGATLLIKNAAGSTLKTIKGMT